MSAPAPDIIATCADPALFARWFKGPSWGAWFAFLKALFGLTLDDAEQVLFKQCTGRKQPREGGYHEAWLIVGRRGGKSIILALIAVFLACFKDWAPYLAPGERGTVLVIAADKKQARVIFRYIVGMLLKVPMLAALVERETADTIDLRNGITIEIAAASFRTVRGYTIVAALCDEIAFWRNEDSANPDKEILASIRPASATVPGAMLLCASSPYARRGALHEAYKQHYAREDDPVLVLKAATPIMNPTISQEYLAEQYEADPASAAAEYGAEFRTDVELFIAREVVDAAVVPGRHELAPVSSIRYLGFADAAGGSGGDSFTSAVAHFDQTTGRVILDAVRERRPPFSPEATVKEHAEFFKSYGVHRIVADRWGGEFPPEQFRKHGVECQVSERVKSDIYKEALAPLNSGKVELLDNSRLVAQICGLERRTARGGRDSIDHAHGSHDDVANAALGVLVLAASRQTAIKVPQDVLAWSRTAHRSRSLYHQ